MNKEQLRMQMLAGIITESEYKTRLDENESLDRTVYYRVVEKGNENINYLNIYKPSLHVIYWRCAQNLSL